MKMPSLDPMVCGDDWMFYFDLEEDIAGCIAELILAKKVGAQIALQQSFQLADPDGNSDVLGVWIEVDKVATALVEPQRYLCQLKVTDQAGDRSTIYDGHLPVVADLEA